MELTTTSNNETVKDRLAHLSDGELTRLLFTYYGMALHLHLPASREQLEYLYGKRYGS